MTKHMVEDIRIKLASGLYSKGDIFLGLTGKLSKEQFEEVVDYTTMPELRKDLKLRITELSIARGIYAQYQEDLHKEVVKAEAAELSGIKYSGFHDTKSTLDAILLDNIQGLSTINQYELRKFYP